MKNVVDDDLKKIIGKKIKLARKKAEYTQEQLAEKTSLSARYISQLERGLAFGSPSTITNICKVLNITSDFLFHDLIQIDSPIIDELVDPNFLEDYLRLNENNKQIIHTFTKELYKMQKEKNLEA